ncbi:alpha/beta fold hydrolase [Paeniglutamicibacter sp. R2-26]|uniref:alpha/beta fold hydrolase n=1 Tax=Paeniglutamicibacter sp. R2-26 TaxID=3144417 RepID=UPI003EE451B5
MKTSQVHLTQLTTNVHVSGVGPDILWIAGGGYFGEAWHEHFVPHFSRRFRNITFDNRGSDSTVCSQPTPWSMADMARDAAELLEKIGVGRAIVVGHSMGGAVALQLALDRPDLVSRAISMASGADTSKHWAGDYMRAEIALRREGVRLSTEFAATHYAPLLYPAEALGDPTQWEKIRDALSAPSFHENNENTVESQWQACLDFDVSSRMHELTVPTDFICFEQDVSAPPALSRSAAGLSPLANYHEIPGLGHCSLFGHRPHDVSSKLDELLPACHSSEEKTR